MRELTKSMLRLSWALPLFSLRQMTRLALPTDVNLANATQGFDALTEAARRELGSALEDLYRTGDQLQTRLVDAMTGSFPSADLFNPTAWMPASTSGRPPSSAPTSSGQSSPAPSQSTSAPLGEPAGWGPITAS